MTHPDDATLQTWYDGALVDGDSLRVESHLAACALCASKVTALRAFTATASAWADAAPELGDLGDAILARLDAPAPAPAKVIPLGEARTAPVKRAFPLRRVLWPALAAAAAIAFALGTRAPPAHRPTADVAAQREPAAPDADPLTAPVVAGTGDGPGGAEVVRVNVQGAQSYALLAVQGMNPESTTAVLWIQDGADDSPQGSP